MFFNQSGYVDISSTPLYEFSNGLSYTSFQYNNLKINSKVTGYKGDMSIDLDVTNSDNRAGCEVVQLFINDVISSVITQVKYLQGFEKYCWILTKTKELNSF